MERAALNAPGMPIGCRDYLVDTQFSLMRALERFDPAQSAAFEEQMTGAASRVDRDPVAPLTCWNGLSEDHHRAYQRPHNQVRLRRLLDYVLRGDRILDVGCGFGYVAGVLLRDSLAASYHGIDIGAHRVAAARNMAAANGLAGASCTFEVRSMFDLDGALMGWFKPTLLLLLEVLEHVPDPVAALQAVIRHMPRECDILVSVPFAGRLESVKGHVSFFNADRLCGLFGAAGLFVQHVEPLRNRWAQVLASRTAAPSVRLAELCERTNRLRAGPPMSAAGFSTSTKPPALSPAAARLEFKPLQAHATACMSKWVHRSSVTVDVDQGALVCRVAGGADVSRGQYGGVRFPLERAGALKLDLSFEAPRDILAVCVACYDSHGAETIRWTRKAEPPPMLRGVVLEPAARHSGFVPSAGGDLAGAIHADVFIRIRPGMSAGFRLESAAVALCESAA